MGMGMGMGMGSGLAGRSSVEGIRARRVWALALGWDLAWDLAWDLVWGWEAEGWEAGWEAEWEAVWEVEGWAILVGVEEEGAVDLVEGGKRVFGMT